MNLFGISITRAPSLAAVRSYGGLMGFIRESFPGAWQKNVVCDDRQTLLSCGPVFSCVVRIATDIAKMRIRLVRQDDGIWSEVQDISPFWPVLRKPNGYQNRIQFTVAWVVSKLLYGNTYILKERDARGIVIAMHVLDPRRVTPLVASDGSVYYQLGNDDLAQVPVSEQTTVPASEIIHDRGITLFHPLVGVSPIYAAGVAATQANRIQANSAVFFENMSRPSGVMTSPNVIDDATAARLKEAFENNFSGGNMGRTAVMGGGLKYEPMSVPASDAQLIEQLKWTGEAIAGIFGVPAYKIGVGSAPLNNNVAALEQQYYNGCLQILLESIELCLDEGLGLVEKKDGVQLGTEFDLDGLLRMDSATMYDALGKAVGAAIMSPNEARAKVNLPGARGGNSPMIQQQWYSLDALAERDQNKPFSKPEAIPVPEKSLDETQFAQLLAAIQNQSETTTTLAADVASLRAIDPEQKAIDALELVTASVTERLERMELECG